MLSKTSWFNSGVLMQNFRNTGWVGIIYLLTLFFAVPLQLLMMFSDGELVYPYRTFNSLFSLLAEFQVLLMFSVPVILSLMLFRYMHVKSGADFVHSLPIKRLKLIHHHLFYGGFVLIIPVIITAMFTGMLYMFLPIEEYIIFESILYWTGLTILVNLLVFMTCSLVAVLTGLSSFQGILTYILLLFPAGIAVLGVFNLDHLIFGYANSYFLNNNLDKFTPISRMLQISYDTFTWPEVAVYLLLTILFYGLTLLVYQKRQVESATKPIAFRYLQPIFKYGVTFCSMLLGGMYFAETQNDYGWMLFGYFIGSLTGYLIAEVVLRKSWRIFTSLKWYLPYVAAMVIILLAIQVDVFGFEKKVPNQTQIERAYFGGSVYDFTGQDQYYGHESRIFKNIDRNFYTDPGNIESILEFHRHIIKDEEGIRQYNRYNSQRVVFGYELTNGEKLIREYDIPRDSYATFFKPIYESMEFKRSRYEILHVDSERVDKITINANHIGERVVITDPEMIKEAVDILKEEATNESYDQLNSQREPWAHMDLLLDENQYIQVNWKKSYLQFESWLKENNFEDNARIHVEDIEYAIVVPIELIHGKDNSDPQTYHFDSKTSELENIEGALKITDHSQIEACLNSFTWSEKPQYMIAFYLKDEQRAFTSYFGDNHVPDFIVKYFK